MNKKDIFTSAGFQTQDSQTCQSQNPGNPGLEFIRKNFPQVIRDNEIKLDELKAVLGLPIDEKINGYGLNFIGRNVAKAQYARKTDKELKINHALSKNFDSSPNMLIKGDNLDCLKILKSYYRGRIKCIYIDPPYNTANDEFVYPDKFDREEKEVLGLANISESDFERLEFSFRTKKSHNGWLSFMYPRLLLTRDLLASDGVIFISIDDNEQANLKLLCDEIFGEENFISNISVVVKTEGRRYGAFAKTHEYIMVYSKNYELFETACYEIEVEGKEFTYSDELGGFNLQELRNQNTRAFNSLNRPNLRYPFYVDASTPDKNGFCRVSVLKSDESEEVNAIEVNGLKSVWRWGKEKSKENEKTELVARKGTDGIIRIYQKYRKLTEIPKTVWFDKKYISNKGTKEVQELMGFGIFDFPKPVELIKTCLSISTSDDDIILDFFAGSGTTGHAVMQLNSEDGGNRQFILCQIDEPIKKDHPAYQFCINNHLPPVISSITIERLKRAGSVLKPGFSGLKDKQDLFSNNSSNPENPVNTENDTQSYKSQNPVNPNLRVFDTVAAPNLALEEDGMIIFQNTDNDALSRIYNMIFSVGIDNPTTPLCCIVPNCMYAVDTSSDANHRSSNYYITHAAELDKEENKRFLSDALKTGKVYIDGWTASINTTLQNYKEDVTIVF